MKEEVDRKPRPVKGLLRALSSDVLGRPISTPFLRNLKERAVLSRRSTPQPQNWKPIFQDRLAFFVENWFRAILVVKSASVIRETEFSRRLPREWMLTPNFERQVLGFVRDRISINTQNISQSLVEAKKEGKDQSFPPNFDPDSLKDIREILLHLERQKFLMHANDRVEGDFWALSMRGYQVLHNRESRKTELEVQEIHKPIKEKIKTKKKRKLRKRKKDLDKAREERKRVRDKERKDRQRQRDEQTRLVRETRQAAIAERIRLKEKVQEERRIKREAKDKQRDEEKRIAKEAREVKRAEAMRLKEAEKLERKEEPQAKRGKRKIIEVKKIKFQSKDPQNETPVAIAKTEVTKDPLLIKLENEFRNACKKLKDHKYKASLPLFKEGEDGDGMQVYFSLKGYLCYRPKETEFPIDLEIALDIYGYEKISNALKQALQMRHF